MASQVQMGTIVAYAGNSPPAGWLNCDGSKIDPGMYPDLITLLGKTTTPDLRGRTLIGVATTVDNDPQPDGTTPNFPSTGFAIGSIGGECAHELVYVEVPPHTHGLNNGIDSEQGGGNDFPIPPAATNEPTYDSSNRALQHNNMQPYYVVNYIICASDS